MKGPRTARKASGRRASGRLVVIEGVTGSGKYHFARLLKEELERRKAPDVLRIGGFREPSEREIPPITEFLRSLMEVTRFIGLPWLCETTILLAEQAYNVDSVVLPALRQGATVLYENYDDALLVYQQNRPAKRGVRREALVRVLKDLVRLQYEPFGYPKPTIIVYLRSPPAVIWKRLEERDHHEVSRIDRKFILKVGREYERLYAKRRGVVIITNDLTTSLAEEAVRIAEAIGVGKPRAGRR